MSKDDSNEIGDTMKRFVEWARAQGFRCDMIPYHLRHFEHFLEKNGVCGLNQVDTALLVSYQRHLQASKSPMTVNGYLSGLHALWRYLLREGVVDSDITIGVTHLPVDHFVPYLYSEAELARIERAWRAKISQAHLPACDFFTRTKHAAFTLLRDCGLRVSEACRLDVEHYDQQARTLLIKLTKFFKTRVIPLSRSTCACLDRYLEHRHGYLEDKADPQAMFLSRTRRRLTRGAMEWSFKQLLVQHGLYQPRRREGRTVFGSTNLHALRHSFAVGKLEQWLRTGDDAEYLLSLLSAYMGHRSVTYTTTYLHLTPTLRHLASERLKRLALPRLDHCVLGSEDDQEE